VSRRAWLAAAAALALGGCAVLGNDRPTPTYFVLQDTATVTPAAQRLPRVLLVAGTTSSAFYDTQSMVFSRAPGTRAYYQFAAWTDRPGKRLDTLLLARLERRAAFAQSGAMTAGIRGDLLLAATLHEFMHDDHQAPGRVRVELTAELTDLGARRLLARRTFVQEAPVSADAAAAAVQAFDTAVTRLLDEVTAWVESVAAAPPRPANPG
jgi:cholesterol transport system auxiliary component